MTPANAPIPLRPCAARNRKTTLGAAAVLSVALALAGCASAPQGDTSTNARGGEGSSIRTAQGAAFKNMGKGRVHAPQVVVHAVDGWSSSHLRYQCDKGVTVLATYLNLEHNDSFVTLAFNNEQVLLRQVPAETGARYVAVDELRSYRWHTQADEAVLTILPTDRSAVAEAPVGRCQRAG